MSASAHGPICMYVQSRLARHELFNHISAHAVRNAVCVLFMPGKKCIVITFWGTFHLVDIPDGKKRGA